MKCINPIAYKKLDLKRRHGKKRSLKQQFDGVIENCSKYLIRKTTVDSCLDLILFANRHKMHRLSKYCAVFIDLHFEKVLSSDEFLEMNTEQLTTLLPLLIYSEMTTMDMKNAIQFWARYRKKERRQHIEQLIAMVDQRKESSQPDPRLVKLVLQLAGMVPRLVRTNIQSERHLETVQMNLETVQTSLQSVQINPQPVRTDSNPQILQIAPWCAQTPITEHRSPRMEPQLFQPELVLPQMPMQPKLRPLRTKSQPLPPEIQAIEERIRAASV